MKVEEVKQFLADRGFQIVDGRIEIALDHGVKFSEAAAVGVVVSSSHACHDPECDGVHLIGTKLAIEMMSEEVLREIIARELTGNR